MGAKICVRSKDAQKQLAPTPLHKHILSFESLEILDWFHNWHVHTTIVDTDVHTHGKR